MRKFLNSPLIKGALHSYAGGMWILSKPINPKSRTPASLRDCDDPDAVRVVDIQNPKRKTFKVKSLQGTPVLNERKPIRVESDIL